MEEHQLMEHGKQFFQGNNLTGFIEWLEQSDESVKIIKWRGYRSISLIGILSVAIVTNISCKGLTIKYLLKFAPPGRPINTLTLFEQVRIFLKTRHITILTIFLFQGAYPNSIYRNVSDVHDLPTNGRTFRNTLWVRYLHCLLLGCSPS